MRSVTGHTRRRHWRLLSRPLADADGDGVPDGCDVCPGGDDGLDTDGDGVADMCDICPFGDDTVLGRRCTRLSALGVIDEAGGTSEPPARRRRVATTSDDGSVQIRATSAPDFQAEELLSRAESDFGRKLQGMSLAPDPEQFKSRIEPVEPVESR